MARIESPLNRVGQDKEQPTPRNSLLLSAIVIGLGLIAWWELYSRLAWFADWFTYSVLHLSPATRLGSTVQFMVFEAPKVMMLLVLVVFGVGILRSYFTPEHTRAIRKAVDEFNRAG